MTTNDPAGTALTAALAALAIESEALAGAAAKVERDLPRAIELMWRAKGRVIVSGLGKSGHVGAKIAASLASMGTPSFFVHSTEALHGDSGMVTPDDVVILISNSGETAEVCWFGRMLQTWGVPIIAMVGVPDSTLGRLGQVTLNVGVEREADPLGLAPTASTTVTLAVGDALAAGLMALRQWTPDQFHERHPGGSLGKLLTQAGGAA
ncbi:MAG: SIS domain-containing protein [Bifidobacteriaceae bacterium]|jgi:arabinose-5-phosphate isomerase|nr:SIS domain-containing protein [Bifidobacteriaceae bacterium]